MKLHNKHFLERMELTKKVTFGLMNLLYQQKKLKYFHIAIEKEDKEGVDFFMKWQDEKSWQEGAPIKIQFKNREDKFQDFPICRFQPLYGLDHPKNVVGRDYKAIKNKMNEMYFTAVKPDGKNYTEILVIRSEKLYDLITEAEKEWFPEGEPWAYFTNELCNKTTSWSKKIKQASNGVQAWFKRTQSEKNPKINLYVPRSYADSVLSLVE
jgi:hypothetical protein